MRALLIVAVFTAALYGQDAQPGGSGGGGGGTGAANQGCTFALSATGCAITGLTIPSANYNSAVVQCFVGASTTGSTQTPLSITWAPTITTGVVTTVTTSFSAASGAGYCVLNTSGVTGTNGTNGTNASTTSTSSVTIGTGALTFTLSAACSTLGFTSGGLVTASVTASPTVNWVTGTGACSGSTLTLTVPSTGTNWTGGSGSYSAWTLQFGGYPGQNGSGGGGGGNVAYCTLSSSTTAGTSACNSGSFTPPTTLTGLTGFFVAGATTTGNPYTANLAGLGAETVYLNGVVTSGANTLIDAQAYYGYFDGTYLQLFSSGNGVGVAAFAGTTGSVEVVMGGGNLFVAPVTLSGNITAITLLGVPAGTSYLAFQWTMGATAHTVTSGPTGFNSWAAPCPIANSVQVALYTTVDSGTTWNLVGASSDLGYSCGTTQSGSLGAQTGTNYVAQFAPYGHQTRTANGTFSESAPDGTTIISNNDTYSAAATTINGTTCTPGGSCNANYKSGSITSADCASFTGTAGELIDSGIACPTAAGAAVMGQRIFAGTITLATNSISSAACQTVTAGSVNSVAATGVASTDAIIITPNASFKGVTGFVPATTGGLTVTAYPTSGYVNLDVCNWSNGSITPGSAIVNVLVLR